MESGRIERGVLLAVVPLILMTIGCAHRPQYVGRVEVVGDVESPGFYGMYEGENAKTVVEQAGEVGETEAKYVLLFHAAEKGPYRTLSLKNFCDYAHEIVLKPDDIVVFSRIAKPQYYVGANGEKAGAYPWTPNLTVGEAIAASGVEGQYLLRTGVRVSRYGEKDAGRAGRRADKVLPGDAILLYDLYQATVPKRQWVKRTPRKGALIVDEEGKLKGVDNLRR
ncbi:MAG: hypothetical protein GXP25_24485 [Planctomycetes bacterium]|nr:hypothetical protein [Planctomycetota bacterium]